MLSSFIVPAIIGIFSLTSWAINEISIISLSSEYVPIAPSTSISILLLSFGLYACTRKRLHPIFKNLAGITIILALLMNLWIITPIEPDPEDFIDPLGTVVDGYYIARASPISIFAMICSSIAIFLLLYKFHLRSRLIRQSLTVLALAVLSIGVITTLGYIYGNPLLYGASIRPVALLASISFIFLGMGALLLKGVEYWPLRLFIGSTVRARLLRIFLPITVFVVLFEGLVIIFLMPETSDSSHVIVTSTIALFTAILTGVIISRISHQLGTDIDHTNELLVKTGEELAQANERLKVLDSITRHDSMNQLTILMGRLGMLKSVLDNKDVKAQFDEPLKAAKSIEAILLFARDYQTIGNEAPDWRDVGKAFESAMYIIRLPEAVKVRSEVSGLQVFGDKMFEKVLVNLLDNSLRHGGHVKNIRLSYRKQWDGEVKIRYEDDGAGISNDDKKLLFQRGFGKHTGLGLFLSKEILGYTGLTISERGEYGKGVVFEISVPEGKYRL